MSDVCRWRWAAVVVFLSAGACSKANDDPPPDDGAAMAGTAGAAGAAGAAGMAGDAMAGTDAPVAPAAGTPSAGGGSGNSGTSAQPTAGMSGSSAAGSGGDSTAEPPMVEELDPSTDWNALTLIFPASYSAYDGVHTFQVPARVDGVTAELSDWQALPSTAATFDPDPEGGGVLITVQESVPEITIAVSSNGLGGTAPLYVTDATLEDWEVGEARYDNGVDYEMPMINLLDLLDPTYVPPATPTDLACNNCHTTGAKYLEIQHTPSQIGYISDADLETIFTQGTKPAGIPYSLLPPPLEYLYPEFHTWQASEQEIKGLIVYLRSLTPVSQGEIVIPDTLVVPMM